MWISLGALFREGLAFRYAARARGGRLFFLNRPFKLVMNG